MPPLSSLSASPPRSRSAAVFLARAARPQYAVPKGPPPAAQLPRVFWPYVAASGMLAAGFLDFPLMAYHFETRAFFSPEVIPLLYAGAMATEGIAAMACGRLYDRFGIVVLVLGIALSLAALPLAFLGGPAGAVASVACWGIGMGAQDATLRSAIARVVSMNKRGTAFGDVQRGVWRDVVPRQRRDGAPLRPIARAARLVRRRGAGDRGGRIPRLAHPPGLPFMNIAHAFAGLALLVAFSWLISEDRRGVRWRIVAAGIALQIVLAALLLLVPWIRDAVFSLNQALAVLERATQAGTSFVFGYLAGGPAPFDETHPAASFVLAFRALPLILVVSALSALLFYWRILPLVVKGFSWLLEKSMGLGGAVGVSAAANVFVGMVEAPLLIKPYLLRLSRSELFMVMVCGMATIAGSVMALYGAILGPVVPDAIGPHPHRLARGDAGGDHGVRADGAGRDDARGSGRDRPPGRERHGRGHARHDRRRRAPDPVVVAC
jgi:MFS family permease